MAVGDLRAANMVEVSRGPQSDSYRFHHPLLQELVYADLLPTERLRIHGLLASLFEREFGTGAFEPPWAAELARHWWSAQEFARAFPVLLAAARAAERTFAFEEPRPLYRL